MISINPINTSIISINPINMPTIAINPINTPIIAINPTNTPTIAISQSNHGVTIPTKVYYKNTTNTFNTFLDTGALQSNYVRRKEVESLIKAGFPTKECNVQVCGVFDDCQPSSNIVVFKVNFMNDDISVLNKAESFITTLTFKVLEQLPYDMIIGRDDIDLYDLWNKSKHYRLPKGLVTKPSILHARNNSPTTLFSHLPFMKQNRTLCNKKRNSTLSIEDVSKVQKICACSEELQVPHNKKRTRQKYQLGVSSKTVKAKRHRTTIADLRKSNLQRVTDKRLLSLQQEATDRSVEISSTEDIKPLKRSETINTRKLTNMEHTVNDVVMNDSTTKHPIEANILWDASPQTYIDNFSRNAWQTGCYQPISNKPRPEYHLWKTQESPPVPGLKVCDEPKDTSKLTNEEERCFCVTTEQLYVLNQRETTSSSLKSNHPRDTNLDGKVNRAHISEFFHQEEEAFGIETTASDLPLYQWDWDAQEPFLVGRRANDESTKQASATSYIPTQIYGSPKFVLKIQAVCRKYLSVFNTLLSTEPALVPPMELNVDLKKWQSNSNRGPPRQQTQTKQEEIHKQITKMLPAEIVSKSQAEFYSQVHLTPKPVHSLSTTEDGTAADSIIHPAVILAMGWRFCIDFRSLNLACTGMGWPIPNIQQMLRRLGSHKPTIFGKLDFTSGYQQRS